MKCPICQEDLPDGSRFCNRCGRYLQTEPVCSKCQHRNPVDSAFGLQCGQPLTDARAPPTVTSSPPTAILTSFANGRYRVKSAQAVLAMPFHQRAGR
jgi:predicted amidophosphoribosyltransferase